MKIFLTQNGKVRSPSNAGLSLVEIMVVIGVMGVMATVGVSAFQNIQEKSKEQIARSVVEKLNKAVHDYNHAYKPIDSPLVLNSAGDAKLVLMSLQYRERDNPAVGEPFMRPDWKPTLTSDTTEYRYIWRGRNWDLLKPGETGAGLKVQFDGTDIGDMVTFPPGYSRFMSH